MSGSLNSLSKGLVAALSARTSDSVLLLELLNIVQIYIEKHSPPTDSDRAKLHEELVRIYHSAVETSKTSVFLHVLVRLKPQFIVGPEELKLWWELLLSRTLIDTRQRRDTVARAEEICLDGLIFNEDDETEFKVRHAAMEVLKNCLLSSYFAAAHAGTPESTDKLHGLLITYARRRTKDFFYAIDPYLRDPQHRLHCLTLLSQFVRLQTQYVYQIFDTPLLDSLCCSLEQDTSTTVVSLALTVLVMILPHIPDVVSRMLSRFFQIFGRILCWDKLTAVLRRAAAFTGVEKIEDEKDDVEINSSTSSLDNSEDKLKWQRLDASFDTAQSTPPQCSQLFTFLYGLYPLNFLEYLRTPSAYLDAHNNGFQWNRESTEDETIRSRAALMVSRHLVHPNMFQMTIETEVSDLSRWKKLEPSEAVMLCVSLDTTNLNRQQPILGRQYSESASLNLDPELHSTSKSSFRTPLTIEEQLVEQSSPVEELNRSTSPFLVSHQPSMALASRVASPAVFPVSNATTLPTERVPMETLSNSKIIPSDEDFLKVHEELLRLQSAVIHSPETYENGTSGNYHECAHFQRELLLLRNELNFEKHLRQQHVLHIGHLQRGVISDAAVEAERQGLYNTTKSLKYQVSNLQNVLQQLRHESTTSKANRTRYESTLNARLKELKEENAVLVNEQEANKRAFKDGENEILRLRMSLGVAQGATFNLEQQLQILQPEIQNAKTLQQKFDQLTQRIKETELLELQLKVERERVAEAKSQVATVKITLAALQGQYDEHLANAATSSKEQSNGYGTLAQNAVFRKITSPNKELLGKMLDEKFIKQQQEYTRLEERHRQLQERLILAEEKVINFEAMAGYQTLSKEHQKSNRPSVVTRACTSVTNADITGKTPAGAGTTSASATKDTTQVTDSEFSSRQRQASLPKVVHGARRTDRLPSNLAVARDNESRKDDGKQSSGSITRSSTPTSENKRESKASLGGRFRW